MKPDLERMLLYQAIEDVVRIIDDIADRLKEDKQNQTKLFNLLNEKVEKLRTKYLKTRKHKNIK